MPMNNTSLDRFYKTTAHWDPWKQYRELINDEYQNGAKSQVIKREFDGVKQYQDEKKRLTEGDRLVNIDVDKGIERFKKAITDASSALDQATNTDPLADLFFHYNSLVVSYNSLTSVSSGQQISQSVITKFIANLQTALPALSALQTKILRIASIRALVGNESVGLQELFNLIRRIRTGNGRYGGADAETQTPPQPPPPPPKPQPAPLHQQQVC